MKLYAVSFMALLDQDEDVAEKTTAKAKVATIKSKTAVETNVATVLAATLPKANEKAQEMLHALYPEAAGYRNHRLCTILVPDDYILRAAESISEESQ